MTEKYTLEEAFDLHDELTGVIADAIGQAVERVDVDTIDELWIPLNGEIGWAKTPKLYGVADLIAKWLMQSGYIVRPEDEVEHVEYIVPNVAYCKGHSVPAAGDYQNLNEKVSA